MVRPVRQAVAKLDAMYNQEVFLKASLCGLFGFGFVAFLLSGTQYWVAPFVLAIVVFFACIAIRGSIFVAKLTGLAAKDPSRIFSAGIITGWVIVFVLYAAYCLIGGAVASAIVFMAPATVLPDVFMPVFIVLYMIGSVTWAARGMEAIKGSKAPPPMHIVERL